MSVFKFSPVSLLPYIQNLTKSYSTHFLKYEQCVVRQMIYTQMNTGEQKSIWPQTISSLMEHVHLYEHRAEF